MSGNGEGVAVIRLDWALLRGDNTPCDYCGAPFRDHYWVELNDDPDNTVVVNCSGERE